jgi:hypothetical protein
MGNMRLISCDGSGAERFAPHGPIGDNWFAAALMATPVACSAGRSAGPNGPMACACRQERARCASRTDIQVRYIDVNTNALTFRALRIR